MKTIAACLLVTVALCEPAAACGLIFRGDCPENRQQWSWTRANFDQAQFNRDVYECMKEARGNPAWDVLSTASIPIMRDACLQARGYYRVNAKPQR